MDAFVRYYDPVAGRFLSEDPVLTDVNSGASFNRYVYANNNPYKYIDPDGRLPILLLVPVIIKGVDMAITAAEVYSAAQTGGASAAGIALAKNAAMNAVPGAKIVSKVASSLHRPYIRKSVREAVEKAAPRAPDGRPIDPNTLKPIDGKPDLGHKHGNEFKREKDAAEAEGLTQKEFNDKMNDPKKYQLEDPSSNRSRKYEKKD